MPSSKFPLNRELRNKAAKRCQPQGDRDTPAAAAALLKMQRHFVRVRPGWVHRPEVTPPSGASPSSEGPGLRLPWH